jgi:hemerythrin-like domain-containing protein
MWHSSVLLLAATENAQALRPATRPASEMPDVAVTVIVMHRCAPQAAWARALHGKRCMSESSSSSRKHSTLYAYMMRSHEQLRDQVTHLLAAMQANARADVTTLWNELDHKLLDHMEAEERFVLPAFAHVDGEEARGLIREHGLIRENLLELGVAVDLHCIRFERSEEFVDLLVRHAAREERLLYRWADDRLSPSVAQAVKNRVAA